ncbi:hypothetical protein HDV05_007946, partial [Chytridiales sp. JEL 0842]
MLNGFIFGFPMGFIPAYIGPWIGGVSCFLLFKKITHGSFFPSSTPSSSSGANSVFTHFLSEPQLHTFTKYSHTFNSLLTTHPHPWSLCLLFRLAPAPYNLTTAFLASTSLELRPFVVATTVALWKNLLHVYIGSTISSVADWKEGGISGVEVFGVLVGLLVGVGGGVYISWLLKEKMKEFEDGEGRGEEVILDEVVGDVAARGLLEHDREDA